MFGFFNRFEKFAHSQIRISVPYFLFCIVKSLFFLLFCLPCYCIAQVPVYEEPMHKVALQNEYIRLIDVNVPPHDTTQYHKHTTPSAIVFLSKSTTGSQRLGGEVNTGGKVLPGNSVYADFAESPVSHRVWNEDTAVYHVMDIEIFPRKNAMKCDTIDDPFFKLAWEQKNVRVYNVYIEGGESVIVRKSKCPHLLILISGLVEMNNKEQQIKPGGFLWYPASTSFKIKNKNPTDAECVLLELL